MMETLWERKLPLEGVDKKKKLRQIPIGFFRVKASSESFKPICSIRIEFLRTLISKAFRRKG